MSYNIKINYTKTSIPLLLLLLLLLLLFAFLHAIYSYTPRTKHVSMIYNVTAILWLQFMVYEMLLPMTHILHFDTKMSK